jgi:streptomycin 6-kinase
MNLFCRFVKGQRIAGFSDSSLLTHSPPTNHGHSKMPAEITRRLQYTAWQQEFPMRWQLIVANHLSVWRGFSACQLLCKSLSTGWGLTADTPLSGEEPSCSYVEAVRRRDRSPAVLKISMPHMEQVHETEGLRFWNGYPTVRLLESDDELRAMLLERCQPGTTLRVIDECEQDIVISGLLRHLWRPLPTPHPFRPLSALIEHWSSETLAEVERWPDVGLVREGLRMFQELPYTGITDVLLATDLHGGNVLRSEREPWLVTRLATVRKNAGYGYHRQLRAENIQFDRRENAVLCTARYPGGMANGRLGTKPSRC